MIPYPIGMIGLNYDKSVPACPVGFRSNMFMKLVWWENLRAQRTNRLICFYRQRDLEEKVIPIHPGSDAGLSESQPPFF